jgi:hypothetical protein
MKIGKRFQAGVEIVTNDSKSRMLAHSAVSYWDIASHSNDTHTETFDLWSFMHVGVPVMHMAVELIVKAIVAISEPDFKVEGDGHNTPKIIRDHKAIPVLKTVVAEQGKMELIEELRKGWTDLRYAEGTLVYEPADKKNFDEIMNLLTEEFKRLSGLRTL